MVYILRTFVKRIPREKFKSLSATVLALVLVFLISIMYGVRDRQADELEYVIDNFEVLVEVSHPITRATERMGKVDESFYELFINEEAPYSLAGFLRDVQLQRGFYIFTGRLYGITSVRDNARLMGLYIDFFDGYDKYIFRTNEHVAVVSERLFRRMDSEAPVLEASIWRNEGELRYHIFAQVELRVVGIVHGVEALAPFWTINEAWEEWTYLPPQSDLMNALMSDNRLIYEFKTAAERHFVSAGVIEWNKPHALTVFDGMYNDIVRTLRQNIMLIDVATPFVFGLSVCIGFVASFLLTRRRKPEFAVMRSIGVKKADVFFGALAEQAVLCLMGVIVGCALYFAVWGEFLPVPAVIFTVCYILGAAISAARAAGTDVLKILREKE